VHYDTIDSKLSAVALYWCSSLYTRELHFRELGIKQ